MVKRTVLYCAVSAAVWIGFCIGPTGLSAAGGPAPKKEAKSLNLTPREKVRFDKLGGDQDRRKFLATRAYLKKNKGQSPSEASPKPMPEDVELKFALNESERKFLLAVATEEALPTFQEAKPAAPPPAGQTAAPAGLLGDLTPQEKTRYDKLASDQDRRKFLITRDYLRNNKGRSPDAALPKPMPNEVDIRFCLNENERKFLLEVAMNEAF